MTTATKTRRKLTDKQLLDKLKKAEVKKGAPISAEDCGKGNKFGLPSVGTFANRFGSWSAAKAKAGCEVSPKGRRTARPVDPKAKVSRPTKVAKAAKVETPIVVPAEIASPDMTLAEAFDLAIEVMALARKLRAS